MEEEILKIIGSCYEAMTPCYSDYVLNEEKTAKEITEHVFKFVEWLQNNEVFGKIHNTHLYVNFAEGSKRTYNLDEVYSCWKENILKYTSENHDDIEIK